MVNVDFRGQTNDPITALEGSLHDVVSGLL